MGPAAAVGPVGVGDTVMNFDACLKGREPSMPDALDREGGVDGERV